MLEKRDVLLMSCFLHISSHPPPPLYAGRFSSPLLPLSTRERGRELEKKVFIPHLRHCQQTNQPLETFAFFNWYVFIFTPLKFTVQLILCWIMTPIDNWLNDVCTSQVNHKVATCATAQYFSIHSLFIHHAPLLVLLALLPLLLLFASVPLLNFNEEIWTRTFIYINYSRRSLFSIKAIHNCFWIEFNIGKQSPSEVRATQQQRRKNTSQTRKQHRK